MPLFAALFTLSSPSQVTQAIHSIVTSLISPQKPEMSITHEQFPFRSIVINIMPEHAFYCYGSTDPK